MIYESHPMKRSHENLVALNALIEADAKAMLEQAKRATGRSQKFLLTEAIRSKYRKYLPATRAA